MALNICDPEVVMSVYSSILNNENNWLLLQYSNDLINELVLHSYGREGLEEMKTKLHDLNEVFMAFYREEVDVDPGFAIVTYVPRTVSGVKRARALVHSRRVGAIFKKHQAIYTVESLSEITIHNIHQAILNPDSIQSPTTSFEPHEKPPAIPPKAISPLRPIEPLRAMQHNNNSSPTTRLAPRKSFTGMYAPEVNLRPQSPPVPPLTKGGSLFSNLLRRKKNATTDMTREDLPPPTPPKDTRSFDPQPVSLTRSLPPSSHPIIRRQRSLSMSDLAVISHAHGNDHVGSATRRENDFQINCFTLPLKGKWSQESALPSDPVERAQRRRELKLKREKEEKEALREEAERQQRLKMEKDEILQQEMEEEARRKYEVEQEIRRITAERRRKEQLEKEEEEQRRRELETRKRLDRERRLEEHRRLEEWRKEQARKEEIAARRAAETRKKEEAERARKIQQVEAQVKNGGSDMTGWITILSKDSLSWKRRFYVVKGSALSLCRSPKDANMETIELRRKVRGLKEWNEGYEDLQAIPYSFVVEFTNGDCWSLYADSEEEKYVVLGLLKIAAGL